MSHEAPSSGAQAPHGPYGAVGGGYNYSFPAGPGGAGGDAAGHAAGPAVGISGGAPQYCCLSPRLKDITKVRAAPAVEAGGSAAAAAMWLGRDPLPLDALPLGAKAGATASTNVVTGADGSQVCVRVRVCGCFSCLIASGRWEQSATFSLFYFEYRISRGEGPRVSVFSVPSVCGSPTPVHI